MGLFKNLAELNLINGLKEKNTNKTIFNAAIYEAMNESENDAELIFEELNDIELSVICHPNISEKDKEKISTLCDKAKSTNNLNKRAKIIDEINDLIDKANQKL